MNQPFYSFTIYEETRRFNFESIGKFTLEKVVLFSATSEPNLYQLSLADVLEDGSLDYFTVSNNGDRDKILATVIQIIIAFFEQYPDSVVAFTGSTPSRTRLYQIALARELHLINERFDVKGLNENGFENFRSNQIYDGFVISLKKS